MPAPAPPTRRPIRALDDIPLRDLVVCAVATLGPGSHHTDEITLAAHRLYPQGFGMRQRPDVPDTARVLCRLHAAHGPLHRQTPYLRRVSAQRYTLTQVGARWAHALLRRAGALHLLPGGADGR